MRKLLSTAVLAASLLPATGCASASEMRQKPPDETKIFNGTPLKFARSMMQRHEFDRTGNALGFNIQLRLMTVGPLDDEAEIGSFLPGDRPEFFVRAVRLEPERVRVELRAKRTIWGGVTSSDYVWPAVADCLGPPIESSGAEVN